MDSQPIDETRNNKQTSWFVWALGVGGFLLAIYLSWSYNSCQNPNLGVGLKALRAFIAGIFNWLYIILYALLWAGKECKSGGSGSAIDVL